MLFVKANKYVMIKNIFVAGTDGKIRDPGAIRSNCLKDFISILKSHAAR